jgi:hypothetical protein
MEERVGSIPGQVMRRSFYSQIENNEMAHNEQNTGDILTICALFGKTSARKN